MGGWEDSDVVGVQPLHKSHCISAYSILAGIIVGTEERRAFILLRQLRRICDVGGCTVVRESQLCLCMSARSGQKTPVIPIQMREHQYQQYVQIWCYPKPRHSVFSAKFERVGASAMPNMWGTQTFSTSPISNLLQSAPSLNFRPKLCRSVLYRLP